MFNFASERNFVGYTHEKLIRKTKGGNFIPNEKQNRSAIEDYREFRSGTDG